MITLLPDAKTYRLWYRVTDKTTGLMKGIVWEVRVKEGSGQGLVVANSGDGLNTDFSLIQSKDFVNDYNLEEPTYKHNLYSAQNGSALEGIVTNLFFEPMYKDKRLINYVHGCTDKTIFVMNTSCQLYVKGHKLVYNPNTVFNVNTLFMSYQNSYMINNGKISKKDLSWDSHTLMRRYGMEHPGNYVANDKTSLTVFYDEVNGKFWNFGNIKVTKEPRNCSTNGSSGFDPNDMPGYKVVAGGDGLNCSIFVLTKDDKYYICRLTSGYTAYAAEKYDISSLPEIGSAVDFLISEKQNALYYATQNQIYVVRLGSSVACDPVYSSPEPITMLRMLRKGLEATAPLDLDGKAVLAITYSGGEGKITLLPIENLGMGNLDLSKKVTYRGFKKISAVVMQY